MHVLVTREHLGPLPASCGAESQGAVPVIALEKVRDEGEPVVAVERQRHYREWSARGCW
jgi:hypothetical protein